MAPAIFDFLNSVQRGRTRANCPYCQGVKCMGACGNNPENFQDTSIVGWVRLETEMLGLIETEDGKLYNFEAKSELGKEILASCPAGKLCQLEAQHDGGSIKHVAYIEELEE